MVRRRLFLPGVMMPSPSRCSSRVVGEEEDGADAGSESTRFISEVRVYGEALGDTDRTTLETALLAKYVR